MNNKKKQTVAVAMATALSVSAMISPVAVHAQEADPATAITQGTDIETEQKKDTPTKEQAPPLALPQELTGDAGQTLQVITLPDECSWADGNTIISKEKTEYPIRIKVDDIKYDYSTVNGYNSDGHYVECNVAVAVTEQKPIIESAPQQVTASNADNSIDVFLAPKAGDVEINEQSFPDDTFREYVKEFDTDKNQKLSVSEISNVITLYADGINGKGAIKTLKGIEYFASLETLYCYSTQITELDVSKNTALIHLSCHKTPLRNLDVSKNEKLEQLSFSDTNITELDVSNNLKLKELSGAFTSIKDLNVSANVDLEKLFMRNTRITNLDVSKNKKLTHLDCAETDITRLDVSNNTALLHLYCQSLDIDKLNITNSPNLTLLTCHDTNITNLDISRNKALEILYCYKTNLQNLDTSENKKLTSLDCAETDITRLDVSNNPNLTLLACNDTKITKLDVSRNKALEMLYCYKTNLQNLDISKNINLVELNCSNTLIEELDVTMLASLEKLWVWHTGIGFLNVSNSPNLKLLDTPQTNLAYLDWGTADLDELYWDSATSIDLSIDSKSFDITQVFQGIDISKVHITSGATLDGNNLTDYQIGKPITYTYNCGTVKGNPFTLDVTLNLVKSDSTIQITGNLDMTYTGKPIENPSVSSTGSTGTVTFTYEKWNGSAWESYNGIPTDAGKYRVTALLAEDNSYSSAETTKEFMISQATNSWKDKLTIADWTYGGQSNTPTATAQFGNPIFTYSNSKTGTFTSDVPVNAGTWYVKATVAGTDNYTGLESIYAFTISPKDIKDSNITVSDINNDNDVDKLIVKDDDKELVKGTDYDVKTRNDGNKTTVTITFKGNYAGTIERSYTVENSQPEKPEQKPQQDKPQDKPKDTGSVKTGDNTQTGLLATLGMMSAGCIALLAGKKRKKNMKEDETTPL